MELSGEDYASHIAKNLAHLHAAWTKEANRAAADECVRLALEAVKRKTWQLIDAANDDVLKDKHGIPILF